MSNSQASVASIDIDVLLSHSKHPVLVDCYAPGCGPCSALSLTLDQLSSDLADQLTIEKLNVSNYPDLARRFDVRSVPTLLLFKSGVLAGMRTGAASRAQLLTWLFAQEVI